MNLSDKIEQIERQLESLSKPPAEIPKTEVTIVELTCSKHGAYQARTRSSKTAISIPSRPTPCPHCLMEELEALKIEQRDYDMRFKKKLTEKLLDELHVPERFKSCTLDNYEAVNKDAQYNLNVCKAYVKKWEDRLKNGGGLVMCGKPGTGKNHLALAIAKSVVEDYQNSALFTTALRIARKFKSTWSKNSTETEFEVIRIYTKPDLLIIDEVGVQFGTEAEKLILFEIINTRYEKMKPTILISNQTREELGAFIGERVIDRMNDGGGCTLAFTWDSYRTRKQVA
ncbi:TPA: ATP-binding protein [Proteus mirabilis]